MLQLPQARRVGSAAPGFPVERGEKNQKREGTSMDVRQRTEEIEHLTFAPWATFSDASRGRAVPEPQDQIGRASCRERV